MYNPFDSDFSSDIKVLMDKLNRIRIYAFFPLILVFVQKISDRSIRLAFLKAIERYLFTFSLISSYYGVVPESLMHPKGLDFAIALNANRMNSDKVIRTIGEDTTSILKNTRFIKDVQERFRSN